MTTALHTPPRWVRWTLVSVAVVLGCLVFGVTTASAELSLGPHGATYAVSTNGVARVDLGPLGTLETESPLPANLGVDVVVGEIPDDLTAIDQARTLEALSGDLSSYLQFFAGPEQTFRAVAHALIVDALERAAIALASIALVVTGIALLLGEPRRREVASWLASHTWGLATAVVVVCVVAAGLTSGRGQTTEADEPASPVFANTPLAGTRITGRLAGVINTYGAQLLGVYEDNVAFYKDADDNLARAWDAREAGDNPPVPAASTATPVLPAGNGAEEAAPYGTPTASPAADDLVTMLLVSDLHCNTGMTPLIATAAKRSGANVVLNAGDTTMNGTSLESLCVDSFASAIPKGVPFVVADGNHDSTETSAQERAKGEEVLDGEVVEVEGIRILGDSDALETRVGQGSRSARAETPAAQARRLAEKACSTDGGIDLLLVHSPRAGNEGLASGCVPVQISGHTHLRSGPEPQGDGVRYVNGTTAGAAPDQPTVGPLHGTAEMTVLRFDPAARRFVDLQLVQVHPDATALVGPRQPFPAANPGSGLELLDDTHPTDGPTLPGGAVTGGPTLPGDAATGDAATGTAATDPAPPTP